MTEDEKKLLLSIQSKEDARRVGKILGIAERTAYQRRRDLLTKIKIEALNQKQETNLDLKEKIKNVLKQKKRISIVELSNQFNVGINKITEAIEAIIEEGYLINIINDEITLSKSIKPPEPITINIKPFYNHWIKFGVVSDTHLNSKYERLGVLYNLYDIFKKEGIKNVFHAGNMIDGFARFNQFDVFNTGVNEQVEYWCEKYPYREGITTHFITGDDHEGWYVQREHINIGQVMEDTARDHYGRQDLHHLGYIEANVEIPIGKRPTVIRIVHPGGGTAYAMSYQPQKIVESLQGGEKPDFLIIGHYHKSESGIIRNVPYIQAGCFPANVRVSTEDGRKRINQIKVGEKVLTDDGSFKKVTKVFKRDYTGDYMVINYGRKNRYDNTVTCTKEHPIKIWRDGQISFVRADEVTTDDWVFVRATKCKVCGKPVPFWMNMCDECNPMNLKENRDKVSKAKGGFKRIRTHRGSGRTHLEKDIVPFCKKMQKEGWQIVPVGADVIPDAIGFKDGKTVAFELESQRGNYFTYKKTKYEGAPIEDFINDVKWIDIGKHKKQPRTKYKPYNDSFVLVKVLSVKTKKIKTKKVYNLKVEGNHTYVAGNICVHNCTEDQTPFMRKKHIKAHIGGWIVELQIAPEGYINRIRTEWIRYFNKDFYKQGKEFKRIPKKEWKYKW